MKFLLLLFYLLLTLVFFALMIDAAVTRQWSLFVVAMLCCWGVGDRTISVAQEIDKERRQAK